MASPKEGVAKIQDALARLADVDRELRVDLQFTVPGLAKRHREHLAVATVSQEWRNLAAKLSAPEAIPAKDAFSQEFDHLVTDVRTMITHMGDTSNLILDPDLDSYYLMDVTLLALPQTQDRLAQAMQYGYRALRHGGPTPEEKVQLAVDAALLQESDIDRVTGSSQTADFSNGQRGIPATD